MSDLELSKTVTLIELQGQFPKAKSIEFNEGQKCFWVESAGFTSWPLLAIEDDALCFRLMIKYKVSLLDEYFTCLVGVWVAEIQPSITASADDYAKDKSPNRAIFLAIANKAKELSC